MGQSSLQIKQSLVLSFFGHEHLTDSLFIERMSPGTPCSHGPSDVCLLKLDHDNPAGNCVQALQDRK